MPDDTPQEPGDSAVVRIVPALREIAPADWDACANPEHQSFDPFVSHAFLDALERSGCVGPGTGWMPRHLVLEDGSGGIAGVAPCYLKSHSQGEYVFDHGWAEGLERAGGRYYPKLQIAVPFTPVPGRRLLVKPGALAYASEQALAAAALELMEQQRLSSAHITFLSADVQQRLTALRYLPRTGLQYHWHNQGFQSFDDFLGTLASRKRKAMRKERAEAVSGALTILHLTGRAITEAHWDAMFAFYMDTGSRKWGRPYLNRAFFSELGRTLAERCLLVFALSGKRPVAGALNLIGGDRLYGRYWGSLEHHPSLHFELCYYQAIEFAIAHGLKRVEAGAQGEHKIARGYLPVETYSSHAFAHAGLERAVAEYLTRERDGIRAEMASLRELGPYRTA